MTDQTPVAQLAALARRRRQLAQSLRKPPPQPPSAAWVSVREAAERLGITRETVGALARLGRLNRTRRDNTSWIYREDVEAYACVREQRRARSHSPKRPARASAFLPLPTHDSRLTTQHLSFIPYWGDRTRPLPRKPGERLITTREAAGILGITPAAVTNLVRRGLLPVQQRRPGRQGSPLLMNEVHVCHLAEQPGYQARRAARDKALSPDAEGPPPDAQRPTPEAEGPTPDAQRPGYTPGWSDHDLPPVPRRGPTAADCDRGEFYTTRQAAGVLGVSHSRILRMIHAGRLTGYQLPARWKKHPWRRERCTGNRWWFLRKADVHALQADLVYTERHARWRKGQDPERKAARQDAALQAWFEADARWRAEHGRE